MAIARPSASAISTCGGRDLLMSVNQNVPACVPAGTNNGCRPNPDLREQQPILVGRRVHLSRPARLLRPAPGALGPLSDLVHAVDVEEQRRRVLLQLADRSLRPLEGLGPFRRRSATPPRDVRRRPVVDGAGDEPLGTDQPRLRVERHGAGVLRAAVQHHVGCHHDPGHCRQADRQRRLHRTERRNRQRLLQPERSREPHVPPDRSRWSWRRWPRGSTSRTTSIRSRGIPTSGPGRTRPTPLRRSVRSPRSVNPDRSSSDCGSVFESEWMMRVGVAVRISAVVLAPVTMWVLALRAAAVSPRRSRSPSRDDRTRRRGWPATVRSSRSRGARRWTARPMSSSRSAATAARRSGRPFRSTRSPGEARLGGELPPRVALTPGRGSATPEIVVLWTARGAATAIRTARSRDGGRTFEPPVALQGT